MVDTVGSRPSEALPRLIFHETATPAALVARMHAGDVDLAVLDGDAAPAGGLGLARQLRDELAACPPLIVIIGRPVDRWLAAWARADETITWPADPVHATESVVRTLLTRTAPARTR